MMLPVQKTARRRAGFTLIETVVALGVCGVAIAALYAASAQTIRVVRSAREQALASQVLEQRFEAFRAQSTWSNVTTIAGGQAIIANRVSTAAPLTNLVETYTVSAHPSGAESFTITVNSNNVPTAQGVSLPTSRKSVKITGRVTWGVSSQYSRTRTQTTILTKGGV